MIVEEALLNIFAPVKILLSDNKVEDAELPPPVTQVPFTEKHLPVARSIAPVKLEVAALVIFKRLASIPPANVEVAVEVVALKYEALT